MNYEGLMMKDKLWMINYKWWRINDKVWMMNRFCLGELAESRHESWAQRNDEVWSPDISGKDEIVL